MNEMNEKTNISELQLSVDLQPFAEFIEERQDQYDHAISLIGDALNADMVNVKNKSRRIADITQQSFIEKKNAERSPRKKVIGIAGPGAVGKGTLASHLKEKGFSANINVTTRPPRMNDGVMESHGVEYHFRTEAEYEKENAEGKYLTTSEKPGRGNYAISKEALLQAIAKSDQGCFVEESPETLANLIRVLHEEDPALNAILLYILPPGEHPGREIVEIVERLKKRSGDSFTQSNIESTCGKRQMDELESIADLIRNGIDVVFVENADLAEAKEKLTTLFIQ